jgi:hypothetical protein
MPIPKLSLSLSACAGLALSVACVCAQNPTSSPAPAAPAAQSTASDSTTPQPAEDCSGPVLHRRASDGGDLCTTGENTPDATPDSTGGDQSQTADSSGGKNDRDQHNEQAKSPQQFDPNVDPFKQEEPLPDGLMPGVKKGTIEDVSAVGERCIGCRGLGNWYSTDWEIRMGKQYADQIEKSTHFVTDPVVTEILLCEFRPDSRRR